MTVEEIKKFFKEIIDLIDKQQDQIELLEERIAIMSEEVEDDGIHDGE